MVVLSRILRDEVNFGYDDLEGRILKKVNDVEIENLSHLKSLIESSQSFFILFEFDEKRKVALKRNLVLQKNDSILEVHKIPSNSNIKNKWTKKKKINLII